MSGNLTIIGDTGIDSRSSPPAVVRRHKEEFKQRDVDIIQHFFKHELEEISYSALVTREPQEGGPIQVLKVEFFEDKAEKVKPALTDLKSKLSSIEDKPVQVPFDKKKELADFVKEYKDNPEVLLLPDIAHDVVNIVGKSDKPVEDTAHKLKLRLGILQTSGRRTSRQNSEPGSSNSSCSQITAKGGQEGRSKSSNIDKYRKGNSSLNTSSYTTSSNSKSGSGAYNKSFTSSPRSSPYGASSNDDFDFNMELKNGFILRVYKASITKLDVDVIVNAANDTMMHGGGVARVISEAAGYKLDKESRDYIDDNGPLAVSKNIVTTAGRMPYSAVIHAVGPMWHDYRDKLSCLDDLFDCVYNILVTCKDNFFGKVAMSAISAGIFAVPKELCADMYVYAAAKFSKTMSQSDCPRELHIIDVDTRILHLVEESVKRWQQDPESLNQRNTIPKYLKENPHLVGYSSYNSRGHRSHGQHRSPRHGSSGGQNSGAYMGDGIHGNESRATSDVLVDESPLKLICGIKRLQTEKFKWGAIATLYVLDKQVTVKIFQGEISKVKDMEAIVCGTDSDLRARGFIADALKKAGGYPYTQSYDAMVKKHAHYQIKSSDVFKCKGGHLGTEYVLHAVVSRVVEASTKEIQAYQDCMKNILKKVKRNGFKRLAIPLFGTGTIQTNSRKLKLCGKALLKALDDYLAKNGDKNEITEIHLVNNNKDVTGALVEVFDEAAGLGSNSGGAKSRKEFDGNKNQEQFSASDRGGAAGARQRDSFTGSNGRRTYSASSMDTQLTDEKEKGHNKRSIKGQYHDNTKINDAEGSGLDDSDSDQYDTIGDVTDISQVAQQPDTNKPAETPPQTGNLMIIDS